MYTGFVGFTSGASGNGKIKVVNGDSITVTYLDESSSTLKTASAIWYNSALDSTGTILLDKDTYYGASSSAAISLSDSDLTTSSVYMTVKSTNTVQQGYHFP